NREAADFVNFVIYRTEKLRIRLAGYVNVSKLIPKEPENEHGLIDTSFGPVQEEISSRDTDQYDTTDDTITVKGLGRLLSPSVAKDMKKDMVKIVTDVQYIV
ncbi:hypothetical protein, partial [Candidatus Glomeribacter gigasporarum]|uniref:hypothetical protein n=1 Tax=Candidatus Glomeribacter gigasporarum TaxID=132144 RepID=UPI0005B27E27